jgi:hypothetical protein
MRQPGQSCQSSSEGRIVVGVVVMVLGILLLLDTTGVAGLETTWRLWPFALLAIGLARVTNAAEAECPGRANGVLLLLLGVWGLVSEFHLFGFDYLSSWPLLLIAIGTGIVWRSVDGGHYA